MQLPQLIGAFALAASVSAQTFDIAVPTLGQTLIIGQPFVVEVDQPVRICGFLPGRRFLRFLIISNTLGLPGTF